MVTLFYHLKSKIERKKGARFHIQSCSNIVEAKRKAKEIYNSGKATTVYIHVYSLMQNKLLKAYYIGRKPYNSDNLIKIK